MKVDDSQLLAYVDGRLPPDICCGVESEIEKSPDIAQRVALLQASALPYRQAFAQQKLPDIPPHLVSGITDMGRAYRLGEINIVTRNTSSGSAERVAMNAPAPRRQLRGLWLAAASIAGAIIGGSALRFAWDLSVPRADGTILSSLPQEAPPWVLAAAGYQRLYSREKLHHVQANDQLSSSTVEDIQHEDGIALRIPDLNAVGLEFKRVQRLRFHNKPLSIIPHAELSTLFRVPDYSAYGSPGPAIHGEYAGWGRANTE